MQVDLIPTFQEGMKKLGAKWIMATFVGTPPVNEAAVPFELTSYKDILTNAITLNDVTNDSVLAGGGKFLNSVRILGAPGVGSTLQPNGKYTIRHIGLESDINTVLNSHHSFKQNLNLTHPTDNAQILINELETDKFLEFDLGYEVPLTGISHISSGMVKYDVEYWNGSAWIVAESVATAVDGSVELSFAEVTTSKVRIVLKSNRTSSWIYIRDLKFYCDSIPATNYSPQTITWCAFIAVNPLSNEPYTVQPVIWADAGALNEGRDVTLNDTFPNAGGYSDLVYFKIDFNSLTF